MLAFWVRFPSLTYDNSKWLIKLFNINYRFSIPHYTYKKCVKGLLAQLDSAPDYGSGGCRFKSCVDHYYNLFFSNTNYNTFYTFGHLHLFSFKKPIFA